MSLVALGTRQGPCPLKTPSLVTVLTDKSIALGAVTYTGSAVTSHTHDLIASQQHTGWTYASYIEQPRLNEIYRAEKMQNGFLEPVFSHSSRPPHFAIIY
jgi:hypothetical protein